MIYSIHHNGDLLAADISSPSGNINVISYMPITVQVITRADTFFMIGNNANTELNKYQGELTLFCTGSASYSVYKNNYIAANRLGTASPNTAFNITKNWIGSIFVDDTGTSSAPNEIFKLYIFKGMLSTQECIAKAGFRGEDHVILEGSSRLPQGYTEVAWLGTTGSQYIDSGIRGNLETELSITAQLDYTTNINIDRLCGDYTTATAAITLNAANSVPGGTSRFGDKSTQKGIYTTKTSTWKINKNGVYVNDVLIASLNATTPFTTSREIWFLASGPGNGILGKTYSAYIKQNGIYVRDYVTCYRDSDGVGGMYDMTNNRFYNNAGSGNFILGPVVNLTQRRIQA